jgi:polysaccharide export outer membrane protein
MATYRTLARGQTGEVTAVSAPTKDGQGAYVIKAFDSVTVELSKNLPDRPLVGERMVRADGSISLGFYGDAVLAGLTVEQARDSVEKHLSFYMQNVKVKLELVRRAEDQQKVAMPTPLPAGQSGPVSMTTFFEPVDAKGVRGQPVPFTVFISSGPTDMQAKIMDRLVNARVSKSELTPVKIFVAGQASSEFLTTISKNKPGPLEMATSFQPMDAKGVPGKEFPITVSISSAVSREMQAKIVERLASVSRLLSSEPLTTDQKVDRILELMPPYVKHYPVVEPTPPGKNPDQIRDQKLDKILERLEKLEEKMNAQAKRQ